MVTFPVDPEIVIFVPAVIPVTIPVRLDPEPTKEIAVTIPALTTFLLSSMIVEFKILIALGW